MEIVQDVIIPACSPRPMNQHSPHYQQWVRGWGTAEPWKSCWIWFSTWKEQRALLSRTRSKWVIGDEAAPVELGCSLAFSHRLAMQAPGSCRWREVLPHIAGMSLGGVRNPIVSVCWSYLFAPSWAWQASGVTYILPPGKASHPTGKQQKTCRNTTWC